MIPSLAATCAKVSVWLSTTSRPSAFATARSRTSASDDLADGCSLIRMCHPSGRAWDALASASNMPGTEPTQSAKSVIWLSFGTCNGQNRKLPASAKSSEPDWPTSLRRETRAVRFSPSWRQPSSCRPASLADQSR